MPSNLEELINLEEEESHPKEQKEKRGRGRPKGSTSQKKEKETVLSEEEQQELTRKKDILVSVTTFGELEELTGEKMSPAKIRLLPKERAEAMFDAYQSKLGQEMTEDSMEAVVGTVVKLADSQVTCQRQ